MNNDFTPHSHTEMAKHTQSTDIRRAIAVCVTILSAATAAAAVTATQPWVTNQIARAIAALPPATADLTAATNYTDAATNAVMDIVPTKQYVNAQLEEKADAIWVSMITTPAPTWTTITNAPVPWVHNTAYALTLPENGTLDFTGNWPVGASAFLKVNAPAAYSAGTAVRLLGYTAWPKSCTWYAAVWFNGSRYLVNPIYRGE